jgi:hypothetical protein
MRSAGFGLLRFAHCTRAQIQIRMSSSCEVVQFAPRGSQPLMDLRRQVGDNLTPTSLTAHRHWAILRSQHRAATASCVQAPVPKAAAAMPDRPGRIRLQETPLLRRRPFLS